MSDLPNLMPSRDTSLPMMTLTMVHSMLLLLSPVLTRNTGEISALIDAAEARKLAGADAARNESAVADDDDEDDEKSGIIPYAQTFDGILSSFRDACGTYALTWCALSLICLPRDG